MGKENAKSFLSTQGMKSVTKGLRAKEVDFKGKRLIVCFNKEQALRDKKKREEIIVRLFEKLKTQGLKSLLVHKEYSKYLKIKNEGGSDNFEGQTRHSQDRVRKGCPFCF